MRKEELRAALDRIQPREELICSTIDKMNKQRLGLSKERRMPALAFATRVMAAFCALMLVVGIGFYNIDSVIDPTGEGSTLSRQADGSLQQNDGNSVAPAAYGLLGEHDSSDIASYAGENSAVIEGAIDAFFFKPLTAEEESEGAIYKCTVHILTSSIVESNISSDVLPDSNEIFSANILLYSEQEANVFFGLSHATFVIELEDSQDGTYWTIKKLLK